MDYEYDVFISYRNNGITPKWVEEMFLPLFVGYLVNSLPNISRNRIFFDKHDIKSGDSWELRIKSAVAKSKCLVSIWVPTYFHSDWCKKEFSVINHREGKTGFRTLQMPSGLILPITFNDVSMMPNYASSIQAADFSEYYLIGDGFKKSERYNDFQLALKRWTENDVVKAIQNAPAFNPAWLHDDWLEKPYLNLPAAPVVKISNPVL